MPHERKTVLITGAGSGIGRALTIAAGERGMDVILFGRNADSLKAVAEAVSPSVETTLVVGDLTQTDDRQRLIDTIETRCGHLDFLINNAGQVFTGSIEDASDAELERLAAINIVAPAALIRDALPLLRRAPDPRVINIGSMFGDIAFPRFVFYSATKHALRGMSDGLRRELGPDGIAVTYAAPRATRTPAATAFDHLAEPMGMSFDTPERVADWIWRGALAGRDNLYPGMTERLGILVQRLLPSLLNRHLGGIETKLRGTGSRLEQRSQPG